MNVANEAIIKLIPKYSNLPLLIKILHINNYSMENNLSVEQWYENFALDTHILGQTKLTKQIICQR
jgi:hypothetical protein